MRALLISTYDLGRQPFGLASPAAWLRRAGVDVDCVDTSRDRLDDESIARASAIAFYLPMHTATRLAAPLIERARRVNPAARLCAYGLYAPLNANWLRARGVHDVIGPEAEQELVDIVVRLKPDTTRDNPDVVSGFRRTVPSASIARLHFITPDRAGLPPLQQYASLRMPDGSRRVVGSTDATRGCKHLCRHCPIVPVYGGQFRAIPIDVVMQDVKAQVEAGAQHITFGDPDFFNGPSHARRLVERLATEIPGVSYDVTIKIEHLLKHSAMLPLLRDSGCLFVTSAVESIDDGVLEKLRKGHTRADFVEAVRLCRDAGVVLVPTFVPFTPWTTLEGYVELLDVLDDLDLVEQVAPIQLAIRLLVTSASPLLELDDLRAVTSAFDAGSLTWNWRHQDPRVDALQGEVMQTVTASGTRPRSDIFQTISDLARRYAGAPPRPRTGRPAAPVPSLTEPWYCCAEPNPEQLSAI